MKYYASVFTNKGACYVPLDDLGIFELVAVPAEGDPVTMCVRQGKVQISGGNLSVQPRASNVVEVAAHDGWNEIREHDVVEPLERPDSLRLVELENRLLEARASLEKASSTTGRSRSEHVEHALSVLKGL